MSDNPETDTHGFPAVEASEDTDGESFISKDEALSAGTMDGEASTMNEDKAVEDTITDEWRPGPAKPELQVAIKSSATEFILSVYRLHYLKGYQNWRVDHRYLGFRGEKSVRVYIGPEKALYIVPRNLLCHHSQYFRATFMGTLLFPINHYQNWHHRSGPFKEGVEQTSRLEETDEKRFQYIIQWIITGDVKLNEEPVFVTIEDARQQFKEWIEFLAVADTFLINPSPATAIAKKLHKLMKDRSPEVDTSLFNGEIIKQVWNY